MNRSRPIRPTGNELSTNMERELAEGFSGRLSVRLQEHPNEWGEIDAVRTPAYTVPITMTDPGPTIASELGTSKPSANLRSPVDDRI